MGVESACACLLEALSVVALLCFLEPWFSDGLSVTIDP